jgi:hypothetical protein
MTFQLGRGERLVEEALANLFRGWEGVGGRLLITDRRLWFESHALNFQRGVTEIPIEEIADVRTRNTLGFIPNGMEVETHDGVRYRFVVWGRDRLIDLIRQLVDEHAVRGGAAARGGAEGTAAPAQPGPPPGAPSIRPGESVEGTRRDRES